MDLLRSKCSTCHDGSTVIICFLVERLRCAEDHLVADQEEAEYGRTLSSLADLLPKQGLVATWQCIENFTIGVYVDGVLCYPVAVCN